MVYSGQISLIIFQIKNHILQQVQKFGINYMEKLMLLYILLGLKTLAGTSQFLREKNKNIKIGLADPFGSAIHNFYKKEFLSLKVIQSLRE